MNITKLTIRHIKGIRTFEITCDPTINEIAGKNGAGKSSVLDAVVYALAGAASIDPRPISEGESSGEVILETEDFTVERRFKEGKASMLKITMKDGSKKGQTFLDDLVSHFTFDPLAFTRMKPADQLKVMQDIAGKDFVDAIKTLEAKLSTALDERKDANRDLKKIGVIPEVKQVEPADSAELNAKLKEITDYNNEQRKAARDIEVANGNIAAIQIRVEDCERRLKLEQNALSKAQEALAGCVEPKPEKSMDEINALVAAAEAQNAMARQYQDYLKRTDELAGLAFAANELDAKVEKLREEKATVEAKVKLPVDGIKFTEDGLRYNNIPFEQLCSSEQIRISCEIGMSLNPKMKLMFVRDGSLLDDDTYAKVKELATAKGYQVFMETVGVGHGDAVILEEGEIVKQPLTDEAF